MTNDLLWEERQKEVKRQAEAALVDEKWRGCLKTAFGTTQGLEVLDWIMTECKLLDDIYTGNAKTHYLAGRQSFAQMLLAEVTRADPRIHHRLIAKWVRDAEDQKVYNQNSNFNLKENDDG